MAQRSGAFRQSLAANHWRARIDRLAVPTDFRARRRPPCRTAARHCLYRVPDARSGHDEHDAERLCQHIVQPDAVAAHGQSGVYSAAAAVARRPFSGLHGRGMGARHDGGAWRAAGRNAVRTATAAASHSGIRAGGCRLLFHVVAGFGGRHLGGKIRPACRLPKLFHHAAHVFVGRVLFAGQPARLLARRELCQPDFLSD